jgi:hypothetical protein
MRFSDGRERDVRETLAEQRYYTYEQAMQGHAEILAHVRATVARLNVLKGKGE